MTTETGFIPSHGNYTELLSYKKSLIVYSGTVLFCERFLNKRDRTVDQMVQAARSGKQNIIEGSMASATSKETEIKLTNVARASQEELLEDYKDYIRNNRGVIWANIMICLVNQCNFLLDRQIRRLERDFVKFGGLRERMSQARRNYRKY